MKIVVTHTSPDWDAITSVWVIKRFLPGWNEAEVKFVNAGERLSNHKFDAKSTDPIEKIGDDEVIHVDTGLGVLDHHQTSDDKVCGASLSWDYARSQVESQSDTADKWAEKAEAITRMVKVVVDLDHFKEVFWENSAADYHEFSLFGVLEGIKLQKQNQDEYYVEFGLQLLDAVLHNFENKIWAEEEIESDGIKFETRWGKGIGFSTINDTVLKLSQKMGYMIVVRKDPRKGYVRIKARPSEGKTKVDLTLVYEKLRKIDPDATWYLHVSKKMLLNGTAKNPKMKPTKLSLEEIVKVLETI